MNASLRVITRLFLLADPARIACCGKRQAQSNTVSSPVSRFWSEQQGWRALGSARRSPKFREVFYLQDPLGDQDDRSSDGLFVFQGDQPTVEIGQLVEVQGTVSEFIPGGTASGNLSITQLAEPTISMISRTPANAATLVMFLAVGGPWAGSGGINTAAFPTALEVDYIRVYQGVTNPLG